ncbi:hypothetical protein INQ15_24945, partial [Escherichia coli]|nr:hypothetical protein [Escherichia coli]
PPPSVKASDAVEVLEKPVFRILVAASALAVACFAPVAASAQSALPGAPPEPVQVMIVGAFHFDNPGQDLNNVVVDPVTTPQK